MSGRESPTEGLEIDEVPNSTPHRRPLSVGQVVRPEGVAVAGQHQRFRSGAAEACIEPLARGRIAVPGVEIERQAGAIADLRRLDLAAHAGVQGRDHRLRPVGTEQLGEIGALDTGHDDLIADDLPGNAGLDRRGEPFFKPFALRFAEHFAPGPVALGQHVADRRGARRRAFEAGLQIAASRRVSTIMSVARLPKAKLRLMASQGLPGIGSRIGIHSK